MSLMTPEDAVKSLIECLGEDSSREGLMDTPSRVIKAFKFFTSGYHQSVPDTLRVFRDGSADYDQLVFQGKIPFWSLCEHHLLPFFGVVHIGYLPDGAIVGLSKLARLVDIFARRFQVQERLTSQIAQALFDALEPRGVGVVIEARHSCMESRGVEKQGTVTTTCALRGVLLTEPAAKAEFLDFVKGAGR